MKQEIIGYYIQLAPKKYYRILSFCVLFLLSINLLLQILYHNFHVQFKGFSILRNLFNVDYEKNIPTLFSYLILLLSSILLALIAWIKKNTQDKKYNFWWIMSGLFLFLATDEILESHEYLAIVLRKTFNLSGIFWYGWVIPFGILIIVLIFSFYRFIFHYLPSETRNKFIIAGTIYIGGSLFMEMAGAYYYTTKGHANMKWIFLTSIEEGMEMFGAVYFFYALLEYFNNYIGSVTIKTKMDLPGKGEN